MALVKCRECGKDVSSEAPTCPHCGVVKPAPKKAFNPSISGGQGCLLIIVILVVIGIIAGSGDSPSGSQASSEPSKPSFESRKYEAIAGARDAVKQMLKDPESAQFSDETAFPQGVDGITVCGYVNAKNGFGGYTGNEAFVAAGDIAYLQSQVSDFSGVWAKACRANGMVKKPSKKKSATKSAKPQPNLGTDTAT